MNKIRDPRRFCRKYKLCEVIHEYRIAFRKFFLCGRFATGYAMDSYPAPPVVYMLVIICNASSQQEQGQSQAPVLLTVTNRVNRIPGLLQDICSRYRTAINFFASRFLFGMSAERCKLIITCNREPTRQPLHGILLHLASTSVSRSMSHDCRSRSAF